MMIQKLNAAEAEIGNAIIGQSGGPTAVINSSVAGVYVAAKKLGVKKVYGMVHGIQGFLADNLCDLDEYLSDETIKQIYEIKDFLYQKSRRFLLLNFFDTNKAKNIKKK